MAGRAHIWVVLIAIVAGPVGPGACGDGSEELARPARSDAARPPPALATVDARRPVVDTRPPRQPVLVRPCDGEPLSRSAEWKFVSVRIALVGDRAYVTDNHFVRRYRVTLVGDDGCRLEPDLAFAKQGALRIPRLPVPKEEQRLCAMLDTLTWQFLADPAGPVYAYDQCRGMYRIDHGVFEPGCPDRLTPAPLTIAANLRGADGKVRTGCDAIIEVPTAVPVAGAVPCGDGLCRVDPGRMRIERFARDGTMVATWSYRNDQAAWWPINDSYDVTPLPDGGLLLVQEFVIGHDRRGDTAVTLARVAASALAP